MIICDGVACLGARVLPLALASRGLSGTSRGWRAGAAYRPGEGVLLHIGHMCEATEAELYMVGSHLARLRLVCVVQLPAPCVFWQLLFLGSSETPRAYNRALAKTPNPTTTANAATDNNVLV